MPEPRLGGDPCLDALNLLYHYLDNELTEEIRITITTHMQCCDSCLSRYEFHTELHAVLRRRSVQQVPESLRDKIAKELGL
jgi:mycothiol system anti-sigma-R factor